MVHTIRQSGLFKQITTYFSHWTTGYSERPGTARKKM